MSGISFKVILKALRVFVLVVVAIFTGMLCMPEGSWAQQDPAPYGIVSLRVTSQSYDAILPWNKNTEESVRGNAAVLEGRRLVTTADLVKNANLLEVRKFGRYPDYPARAVSIDYDLNLALVEVDDPRFWEGLKPLPLADRPVVSGQFAINRWRSNGRFERGSGEVVDFLVTTSPFGLMEFPMMRATTAMGGLGWAEILTSSNRIIGLITSHGKQNLHAVNSDMIRLFAQAARQPEGTSKGEVMNKSDFAQSLFAHRGFAWQRLNQSDLRAYQGIQKAPTGILVRKLFPGGTGSVELREGDILHRVNGYDIDPEGKIDHPVYGLLLFSAALNESLDPMLQVDIQREGERLQLHLDRSRFSIRDYRVEPPRFDRSKDYEVFGGLVLQELTLDYLRAWGKEWQEKAPTRLVIEYSLSSLREKGKKPERVLIVSKVLPDPSNLGYESVTNAILRRVNGRVMNSLDDFREALDHPLDGYHLIDLLPGQGRGRLVYPAEGMVEIDARVRQRYGIPDRSPSD